jgi:hypothetical protein
MAQRKFFLLSSVLAVLAILSHFTWLSYAARATSLVAESIGSTDEQRMDARQEADRVLQKGVPYYYLGIGLATVGFVSWISSVRRRERAWRLFPLALLVCYLFTWFLMV